VLRADPANII
jgi:origin recognition complex subunit 5